MNSSDIIHFLHRCSDGTDLLGNSGMSMMMMWRARNKNKEKMTMTKLIMMMTTVMEHVNCLVPSGILATRQAFTITAKFFSIKIYSSAFSS